MALYGVAETISIPAVLKLRRYVNVPRKGTHWSRRGVLQRDNYTCIYCGIQAGKLMKGRLLYRADFTIDHILPQSRNGRNTWSNTACACRLCNGRKGDCTPHEAGIKLR
jgi:5-methylcytosine-specific restriction endonuclease McrA